MGREKYNRRHFLGAAGAVVISALAPRFASTAQAQHIDDDLLKLRPLPQVRTHIVIVPNKDPSKILILDQHREHYLANPASTTKLTGMAVDCRAIEAGHIGLDEMVPITQSALKGTLSHHSGLTGSIPMRQNCEYYITQSFNDIRRSSAEYIAGLKAYREQIKSRGLPAGSEVGYCGGIVMPFLQSIGLKNTRITNSTGLPPRLTDRRKDVPNVTTAYDMALLCNYIVTNHKNLARSLCTVPYIKLANGNTFLNTNHLLENAVTKTLKGFKESANAYPGTYGLKTGYINDSLFNIAVAIEQEVEGKKETIIIVTFGEPTDEARTKHVRKLADANFAKLRALRRYEIEHPQLVPSRSIKAQVAIPNINPQSLELPPLESRDVSTLERLLFPRAELLMD